MDWDWIKLIDAEAKEKNFFKKKMFWLLGSIGYRYFRIKLWIKNKNFNKTHISYGSIDGRFQIKVQKHKEFIKTTQEKLDTLALSNNLEDYIRLSLIEALQGCNYVVFERRSTDEELIQFWTGNKKIHLVFFANKRNGLKIYYKKVTKMFINEGLIKSKKRKYGTFQTVKNERGLGIGVEMEKDIELAVKCAKFMWTKIYKLKADEIRAKVDQ